MKVVNTKTQKEWDFVLSKFNPRKLAGSVYDTYRETSVIILDGSPGTYANLDWAKEENCTVISFEDWCKENGHVTRVEVFPGIYIGDVVVSLTDVGDDTRLKGDMFTVDSQSSTARLYYLTRDGSEITHTCNSNWRLATEEEAKAFREGIKNISDIPKKVEEVKFEVGQWYRGDIGKSIYYIKPFKLGNCARIDGETIINNTGYNSNNYFSNEGLTRILKPLTNLSEIQSYLPEGHPDKIWIPKKDEWVKVNKTCMGQDYDGTKYLGQVFQVSEVDSPSAYGPWVIGYKTNGHPPGGIYVCDLIPATSSEIIKKFLLEEAISKYPIGTKYKCASTNKIFNVELQKFIVSDIDNVYGESGKGCLYYKSRWAEIVNAEIIPKVGKWYAITAFSDSVYYFIKYIDGNYHNINYICGGIYHNGGAFMNVNILREVNISEIEHLLPNGHVDKHSDKSIWEVGDCFVVEEAQRPYNGKLDFCYKIEKIDNEFLYYESSNSINLNKIKCRKATLKEIVYYNKVGKPYDINTMELNNFIPKVGDYVVVDKYSKDYNGRVLEITTIKDNKYYYFNVIDGGYYRSGHNFSNDDGEIIRDATDLEILAGFRKYVENKSQFLARFQLDNYLKTCNMKLFNAIPGKTSSEKADYLWKECFLTIEKNELQVGGYVRFLINYGGHKKGTIGKITRITSKTINVNLPYYRTTDDCCLASHDFEWLGMEDPIIGTKVLIDYYVADETFKGQPLIEVYPKTPKESVKKGFDEAAYNNSPINQLIILNIKKPKKVKIRL